MAKISIEMDTKDNVFKVSLDGKDIAGVCYLSMRMGHDDYPPSVSMEVNETEEDSDVRIIKFIEANKLDKIISINKKNNQVNKDVVEFFK